MQYNRKKREEAAEKDKKKRENLQAARDASKGGAGTLLTLHSYMFHVFCFTSIKVIIFNTDILTHGTFSQHILTHSLTGWLTLSLSFFGGLKYRRGFGIEFKKSNVQSYELRTLLSSCIEGNLTFLFVCQRNSFKKEKSFIIFENLTLLCFTITIHSSAAFIYFYLLFSLTSICKAKNLLCLRNDHNSFICCFHLLLLTLFTFFCFHLLLLIFSEKYVQYIHLLSWVAASGEWTSGLCMMERRMSTRGHKEFLLSSKPRVTWIHAILWIIDAYKHANIHIWTQHDSYIYTSKLSHGGWWPRRRSSPDNLWVQHDTPHNNKQAIHFISLY